MDTTIAEPICFVPSAWNKSCSDSGEQIPLHTPTVAQSHNPRRLCIENLMSTPRTGTAHVEKKTSAHG